MFSSISQPISALSQRVFSHGHIAHINSQQASHILCMNLQAWPINATLQEKMHTFSDSSSMAVIGISKLILAHTSQYFHQISSSYAFLEKHLTFSTETHDNMTM